MTKDEEIASLRKTLDYWQRRATTTTTERACFGYERRLEEKLNIFEKCAWHRDNEDYDQATQITVGELRDWRDEIERLHADKKALTFQLDETIANLARNEAEVERLHSLNAELVAALKPFGDYAKHYGDAFKDTTMVSLPVTIGELRQARAALAKVKDQ